MVSRKGYPARNIRTRRKRQGGGGAPTKTLVMYCYYETDATKKNLEFFIKNGVFQSDAYRFIFIVNNTTCTVTFPTYSNIEVKTRAENQTDLETYSWCIDEIDKTDATYFSKYTNLYFINSSCIGPFIPTVCDKNWIEHLNTASNGYDLVGPVIEVPPDTNVPFIHSYMFGTSQNGFKNVRETLKGIHGLSKEKIVLNTERKLTGSMFENNLKVKSLLLRFKKVDINDKSNWDSTKWRNPVDAPSCYEVPGNYFGMDLNPLEVIFVKNIRNTNETRDKIHSGISEWLTKALTNYVQWSE